MRTSRIAPAIVPALVALALALASTALASAPLGGFAQPGLNALNAPEVTNVAPATGPATGGTPVGIGGKNLSGATAVDFGSTPAASFVVKSASKIEAVAPPGSEGTVDVTVTTPEGTSATSRADHFSYVPPGPAVVEVTPEEGAAAGGRPVNIIGAHFENVTGVSFGGAPAAHFEVVSPEKINAVTPVGAAPTVDVTVTTTEGTSPANPPGDEYHFRTEGAEISGLSTNKGPAAGGQTITILGLEFFGVEAVEFGSASTTDFTVDSPESITVTTPPQTAETVAIRLATTFGPSRPEYCPRNKRTRKPGKCIHKNYFKYLEPTVTSASPSSGPKAGGTEVAITGSGFGLEKGQTEVLFGENPSLSVTCSSTTSCTAISPGSNKSGPQAIKVTIHGTESKNSKKNPAATFTYE